MIVGEAERRLIEPNGSSSSAEYTVSLVWVRAIATGTAIIELIVKKPGWRLSDPMATPS